MADPHIAMTVEQYAQREWRRFASMKSNETQVRLFEQFITGKGLWEEFIKELDRAKEDARRWEEATKVAK